MSAEGDFRALPLENISHATQYVYAVSNNGDADAEVSIQVGPDEDNLAHDLGPQRIPAHTTQVVTPLRFSKFVRLLYRCSEPAQKTDLSIVFQAQVQNHG